VVSKCSDGASNVSKYMLSEYCSDVACSFAACETVLSGLCSFCGLVMVDLSLGSSIEDMFWKSRAKRGARGKSGRMAGNRWYES